MTVIIYSKPGCSYCDKAKIMMKEIQLPYEEVVLKPEDADYTQKRDNLFSQYNHKSYPIIIVGGIFVGGYSELVHSYDTLKLHSLCADIGIDIPFEF